MDIEITGPPQRRPAEEQRPDSVCLEIPLNAPPDSDFLHKLTRAPEFDHKIFEPRIADATLIVLVRLTEVTDAGLFMDRLSRVFARINAERRLRMDAAARARAAEEQRRARVLEGIDRGLEDWWRAHGAG